MAGSLGGFRPPILTLLANYDTHPEAFAYDWRTRFGMSAQEAFDGGMSWREAWHLAQILFKDPTSWVCAAVNEWESPRSPEWFLAADLYDLTMAANSKRKAKPYPRPGAKKPVAKKLGKTALPRAEALRILNDRSPARKPGRQRGPDGRFIKTT